MNKVNLPSGIREFIAQLLSGTIHDFTRKGTCSKCGECCSNFLPLSASEIFRISLYLSEHHILPMPLIRGKYVYAETCPFLDAHKRCLIYEARPLICKAFKCNKKAPNNKYLKLLLLEDRTCVDVRHTFFHTEGSHENAQ